MVVDCFHVMRDFPRYHRIYSRREVNLADLLQLPVAQERPPDFCSALAVYRSYCKLPGSEIKKVSNGGATATDYIHLANRTGPFTEKNLPRSKGNRWRAPLSIDKVISFGRIHPDHPQAGRLTLLYDLQSGLLQIPPYAGTEPEKIVRTWVIPYLGLRRQLTRQYFHKVLQARHAARKYPKKRIIRGKTVTEKDMTLKHLTDLKKVSPGMGSLHDRYLHANGLSLETAFLLPRIELSNTGLMIELIAQHLTMLGK